MDLATRARDIATFLDVDVKAAQARLSAGFHANHALVAEDFRRAAADVNDEQSLIDWYRNTDAYIWELSAYHLEPGFNYMGMCAGIGQHLNALGHPKALVLGDGVGDLSLHLVDVGLMPTYHDLAGSRTSGFAAHLRQGMPAAGMPTIHTIDFEPPRFITASDRGYFDAVVALDFFEHLVNVEDWARFVYDALRPGGIFMAQNAFAIGDAEHGDSIPMHLSINNRYAEEWPHLMQSIGFKATPSGWWER